MHWTPDRRRYVRWLILGVVSGVWLLMVKPPSYILDLMVLILLYSIATVGLILFMGYAGQISLGQSFFYATGAYTTAILTTRYSFTPLICLGIGVLLSAAVAAIVGTPILKRLRGHSLAGVTFALSLIMYNLLTQLIGITGGANGIAGIPPFSLGTIVVRTTIQYYYLLLAVLFPLLIFSENVVHSRTGRALRTLHEPPGGSEDAALALGVDATRYKVSMFVLSAIYASIAGSFYAHYMRTVDPAGFSMWFSVIVLMMAVVGGQKNVWGAPLGAAIFIGLGELLREVIPRFIGGPSGAYEVVGFGVLFALVLMLAPQGLIGIFPKLWPISSKGRAG